MVGWLYYWEAEIVKHLSIYLDFIRVREFDVHVFQRQLEQFGAGTPVIWKIYVSQNKFRWKTRSWNTSQL